MSNVRLAVAIRKVTTAPVADAEFSNTDLWLSTEKFSTIAGIKPRAARTALARAVNGLPYKGRQLDARYIAGASGQNWKLLQVYGPSLPADLRAIWHSRNPGVSISPTTSLAQRPMPAVIDVGIGGRVAEMKWKFALVASALCHPKGSTARATALTEIAAREHPGLHGKPVTIAVDTLRDWALKIESGNEKRLARPRRADAGKSRYFVNAKWDQACPLPDTEKRPIATAIELHIRGLWKAAIHSERKIDALASAELQQLSRIAGWHDAPLIRPGLHLVRKGSPWRLAGIKAKDSKRFYDAYTPSIHRRRPDWPMETVLGDVHPVDVLVRREDGTTATPRMIAWLDLASGDIFYTLVLLPAGKGVTQAHIIASFVEMVQAWGLPRTLYLDNGAEYLDAGMIAGFEKLQGLCEGFRAIFATTEEIDAAAGMVEAAEDHAAPRRAVVRAKPYNAKAKAIEGAFACLEKFIALIPGYIGGNRMKKKTHNVGKEPNPFPGTFEQFRDGGFAEAVAFYRNEPQRGTMGGKSPNERKREAFAAADYQAPFEASIAECLFAFGSIARKRVETGGIKIVENGVDVWFWHDALTREIGNLIEYRYANWDGRFILWIDPEGKPVTIPRDTHWHPLDISGAKEQGRRKSLQLANVRHLENTSPSVDTIAAMARYNAALPAAPQTPAGPRIRLGQEARALVDAIDEAADATTPLPEKLPALTYRDSKTGVIIAPAALVPQMERPRYDIYTVPPPQRTKPDASADAPGFDIYAALVKTPTLNSHEKETEKP